MNDEATQPATDEIPLVDAIRLTVGDEVLVLDLDISPALAGALRQQSHGAWRVPSLMAACTDVGGPGPEEVAGLLFLARRQSGDYVITYDAVAGSMSSATDVLVEFGTLDEFEEPDSPEA